MSEQAQVRSLKDIPGWFPPIDHALFEQLLSDDAVEPRGDLVELGVYLGRSAALIGQFKRPDEIFTVCDLFGAPAAESSNVRENNKSYPTLDRSAFERNYLSLFDELPRIVQDFSSSIVAHVAPHSVRFLHVDASHMYEHVAVDVQSAIELLLPQAVVVFDDFRSDHTPGVSAAVWEAVFTKNLSPICVTHQKLYGTFGDRTPHQERLLAWLQRTDRFWWETQMIAGAPVLRVSLKAQPKPAAQPAPGISEIQKQLGAIEKRLGAIDETHSLLGRQVQHMTRPYGRGQLVTTTKRAAHRVRQTWRQTRTSHG